MSDDKVLQVARECWKRFHRDYCDCDIVEDVDKRQIDDVAALIRPLLAAGESRERELARRLQVCLADIDTLLLVAGSDVLPEVERMIKLNQSEAEKLLRREG